MAASNLSFVILLLAVSATLLSVACADSIDIAAAIKNSAKLTAPHCPKINNPAIKINEFSFSPNDFKSHEKLHVKYNIDIVKEVEHPTAFLDVVAMGFIPVSQSVDICQYAAEACPLKTGHFEGETDIVLPDIPSPVPWSVGVEGDVTLYDGKSKTPLGCYNVKTNIGTSLIDTMKGEF